MECGASLQPAVQPHAPSHEIYQALSNGKAKTCSPVVSRGGSIGLRECFKHEFLFVFRNADACVRNREMQFVSRRSRTARDLEYDLALLSEFHSIAQQIEKHLPQPYWITNDELRDIGRNVIYQLKLFIMGEQCKCFRSRLQQLLNVDPHPRHVDFTRFHFCKVNNVVHHYKPG